MKSPELETRQIDSSFDAAKIDPLKEAGVAELASSSRSPSSKLSPLETTSVVEVEVASVARMGPIPDRIYVGLAKSKYWTWESKESTRPGESPVSTPPTKPTKRLIRPIGSMISRVSS